MTFSHIPFPSIEQYRSVIKRVQDSAKYHNVPVPVVSFMGTVKLHGTNAGVVVTPSGEVYFQSRERVITPESDNAGFAIWAYQHKEYFKNIAGRFPKQKADSVQIYGEWCGGNIQKGIGLSHLPKMFVIFGVRVSENAECTVWQDIMQVEDELNGYCRPDGIRISTEFPVFTIRIDFNKPEYFQNDLQDLTLAVEKDCPVARKFLPDFEGELIGEGIVWEVQEQEIPFDLSGLRFKTKGEKHSSSKVKTLVTVDVEKVKSVDEFVDKVCTENRLNQGLSKLREMGLETSTKTTGDFIRWVVQDCIKEEIDVLSASGLTVKDISGKIATKARQFYLLNLG